MQPVVLILFSQYVDDFVNLYKGGSSAEHALNHKLKRLLGQDWEEYPEFEAGGFSS